jgi:nucleoside-diphosphate-sugar epimerase
MVAGKRIAVAGATGRAGRHVVDLLQGAGHDVVAMSRESGVDVINGDGLAQSLSAPIHRFGCPADARLRDLRDRTTHPLNRRSRPLSRA